ncbi:hypothetical protein R1sor_013868 [Riccia sorocarpa]|uniref:Uncharacterized protein n=1 Tax=Riccia sorocarpa TaxID=122646 RepID=A0ABD3HE00_9MARC
MSRIWVHDNVDAPYDDEEIVNLSSPDNTHESARKNDDDDMQYLTPTGDTQAALAPVISSLLGVPYKSVKDGNGGGRTSSMRLMDVPAVLPLSRRDGSRCRSLDSAIKSSRRRTTSMNLMDVRSSDPGKFESDVTKSREFRRKRSPTALPDISRKLEDDFGYPGSGSGNSNYKTGSGSSRGSDCEDSTDSSPMKVPRKDLGLSPPRLFPTLTASIERQRLLFLASMSPPRNVFTNFPSPRLQQSPPTLGVQDQNAQYEDEDRGPFETEVLSDNEGYKSNEEVPVSAPGRRFKETLREPKPPRVNQYSHGKSRSGEVDTGFVLSKLTPECLVRDQRQFCCSKTCVWNLGINMLRRERKLYFRLTRSERAVYLDTLITKLKGWRVTYRLSQNIFVCRKAFKIVFSVGNNRLQRMRLEDKHPAALNTVVRQPSAQAFILLEWLDSFFLSHCERQPGDGKYHLPNNFTKKEVYDHYKTDMSQMQSVLQYSSFKRYWLKYYPLVTIPTTNKFSVCDFCEFYKTKRDKAVTKLEKAEAIEALQLHRKQQAEERAAAGRRRWKALDTPKDCAYIQIDGMDQKKTALPHFSKQPKSVDGAALVGVHLVGAMQEDIGRNIGKSIRERLIGDMCWLWPVPPERDAEEEVELLAVTIVEDLRRRVFGIRRPIYFGPRKPPPGSAAADRAAHIGELTEIHDKSFLAVLAEDEVSFWICQVLKINGRNEAGEPTEVMIQWYATEDSNPYTGKFYPEKRRSNGEGRPVLFRQEVNLEAVTILSFNFIFTTTRRLRRITERQIRTGLFRIARDKEASELDGNISPASDIVSADDEETDCSGPDSDPDVQ